jgi:hypothetical protein
MRIGPPQSGHGCLRVSGVISTLVVKLNLSHSIERANSQLIAGVSPGWPQILSNLKSLLETGKAILS